MKGADKMGLRRSLIFFGISAFIVLCCAESKAVDYIVGNDAIRRVVSVDATVATTGLANEDRIQPSKSNPRYWQYESKPVLLLGGTDDDNLFQWTSSRLIEQLDLLKSVGGNYVRCTMSSRDEGNVWPFKQDNGKYDLDQWNEEYWNRFERMLKLTRDRNIVVQIEVWAFHDFNKGHWEKNPWRPAGNINYTESNTTLKDSYGNIGQKAHGFFFTVPKLKNDRVVLPFQQKFVDKILSHSLRYGHVLYCMTNEIHPQYSPELGWYWAGYIKDKAAAKGKGVEVSEMLWEIDLKKKQQRASLDRPDIYSFFEASQNSAKMGQQNWDNLRFAHHYMAEEPRPINHVKIYGADTSTWNGSTDRHATECFWRNIIGGSASSRFHRPPWGLGLRNKAQAHIKSLRMLTNEMDIFTCVPHNDLLSNRKENGAYATANPGKEYAVYFPSGAEVDIDLAAAQGRLNAKWLDIAQSRWAKEETLEGGSTVALTPPGKGHWVVLIKGKMMTKSDRIRVSPRNPRYFEYKGTPVFLTGARELEMLPRVGNYPYEQAVDALAEAGCNHWRIEMYISDCDHECGRKYPLVSTYDAWWHDPVTGKQEHLDAFQKNAEGKYDLDRFNEPFWNRFQSFCELCAEKGIVLTVEMWSTYTIWATSPFNPENNINYSGPLDVGRAGRDADSKFVRTVPGLDHRPEVLRCQENFIKKILDCTWEAGNVLYVCGNENRWPREWVEYWAGFVHKYGQSKGVALLYTNIPEHTWFRGNTGWARINPDRIYFLLAPGMEDVLTRPQCDFADMSQLPGDDDDPRFEMTRYEMVVDWHERSKNDPKPITILKNYVGSEVDADVGEKRRTALEYFMAGAAMPGFHRPWAGDCPEGKWNNCSDLMRKVYLISLEAASQVAAFTSNVEFVDTTRRNDLVSRGWSLANPGNHYIVYLKKGGKSVDVKLEPGSYRCKAFDGQLWSREDKFEWPGGWRTFSKAGNEDWGLYIVREEPQTH